ncbi:hypothetical protein [Bordetella genomosp. 1]|uniref:hypothetical protein n=1 Tax=Bordetella genomosp. 1 TaxID=1395607 RepID=UPI0015C5CAF7|nr:hypothetical protein [Bordetella genomosp. 1]
MKKFFSFVNSVLKIFITEQLTTSSLASGAVVADRTICLSAVLSAPWPFSKHQGKP